MPGGVRTALAEATALKAKIAWFDLAIAERMAEARKVAHAKKPGKKKRAEICYGLAYEADEIEEAKAKASRALETARLALLEALSASFPEPYAKACVIALIDGKGIKAAAKAAKVEERRLEAMTEWLRSKMADALGKGKAPE